MQTHLRAQKNASVPTRNSVLATLNVDDAAWLTPHLQLVDLPREQPLERRGRVCDYIYFIERGVAYTIADGVRADGVEIGMIGREGFVGASAALGQTLSGHDVRTLVAGAARRAPASTVRELMDQSASFRKVVHGYVHSFLLQVMRAAQVNARATLEARLARWLLMMHDRVDGDDLQLTHDRLAAMLGVRRAGVSVAAKKLERAGIILLRRGSIVIQDRKRLEESSAGAYGAADWLAMAAAS